MADSFQESNLQALLEKIAQDEDFKKPKFSVVNTTKPGENFVGCIITAEISEEESEKVLSLIFKTSSPSKAHQEHVSSGLLFRNESDMYESVFPALNIFLKEYGVADYVNFPGTARWFGSEVHDEPQDGVPDVIVLENKKIENFAILDINKGLDVLQCRLVIERLAVLHGTSLAMNALRPELDRPLRKMLEKRIWNNPPDSLISDMKLGTFNGLRLLREPYKKGNPIYDKLFNIYQNFHDVFPKLFAAPEDLSCVTHSDTWTNNILFKINKDGITEEVCLLDFQTSGYSSPVVDLSVLLMYCTTKELRDVHFEDLRRFYFDEVSKVLRSFGCDANEIFPLSLYESHWSRYGRLGVILSVLGLPVIIAYKPNVTADIHASEGRSCMFDHTENIEDPEVLQLITTRISDVVSDAVQFGLL